jgi:aryl-alcohol dehydrogenase-like predicted oxidoreductase
MAIEAISDESVGTLSLGDLEVRRLGFGAMRISGEGVWGEPADRDGALAVLRRAIELGVNLIDTADSYGPAASEELIAEALRPYPDELVIATKGGFTRPGPGKWVPNGRPEYLREACERSLRRLQVDQIDLYQLHVPDSGVPFEESVGALKDLRDEGKIRQVGVSNVSLDQLATALGIDRDSAEVLAACQADDLAFIPWFPLNAGALAERGGVASEIAERHGVTPAQVALAWLLTLPSTLPIPGTSSVLHLEENLAAASLGLSDDEVAELTDAV